METLTAISRWLAKQHVVTWCVQQEGENSGALMPFIFLMRRKSPSTF